MKRKFSCRFWTKQIRSFCRSLVLMRIILRNENDLMALVKTKGYVSKSITQVNVILEKFSCESLIMVRVSEKNRPRRVIFSIAFRPVLGLATKGLLLVGNSRFHNLIAVLMQPEKFKQVEWRKFIFALPFYFYGAQPFMVARRKWWPLLLRLILVVVTACLRITFASAQTAGKIQKFTECFSVIRYHSFNFYWLLSCFGLNYQNNQQCFQSIDICQH